MENDDRDGSSRSGDSLVDRVPGMRRLARLPRQLIGKSPFGGTILPGRVPLLSLRRGRPSLPFPHPWNYREPLRILETFFWEADGAEGEARHNRYLEVPGFAPVLVTRDPRIIREISAATGDKPGMFDRDTMPPSGIARATGRDSLLYSNGPSWKRQKKLATPPFARTTLFQPEQFREFAQTFRATVHERLEIVRKRIVEGNGPSLRVRLEDEIKALMLEMLVNCFFGAEVPYQELRERHVPALQCVIDHIVRDTVINKAGLPLRLIPGVSRRIAEAKQARAVFEELTDRVLAPRRAGHGLWSQFKSDVPDEALRSNIRVFLAGALEATTSFASWAISHLARNDAAQQKVHQEVRGIEEYTPETLESATYLGHVLNETLRLTPSLYFHPRRATANSWIETSNGDKLMIPRGTHILLDVWHANRHEDHWGVAATGHPAGEFVPERWALLADRSRGDLLHFGFGHGPRFCPGKSLGQLEVALVVGACVKLFRIDAVNTENPARAGVSTKPLDGVLVDLHPRLSAADAQRAPPVGGGQPTEPARA
jgi:cytochrome P450